MDMPLPLLSPLLLLPGLIFEGLVRARNSLYSQGLLKRHRLRHPVISIGNLTVGGSGKTPLAIHTASVLRSLGASPVLLSRGYGRLNIRRELILSPGNNHAPVLTFGDEPALIRRHVPEIWLGISRNRFSVAQKIAARDPNVVFILDDGFQHRVLERNLDILIIDCSQPLTDNHVLPRGTLREPISGIRRAQLIVLNMGTCAEPPCEIEQLVRSICPRTPLLQCRQELEGMTPYALWQEGVPAGGTRPQARNAFLVAAIGNPLRFRYDVERAGITVCGGRYYRDHRKLQAKDWRTCVAEATACGADFLLITEKDAIKTTDPPEFPLMVAIQATRILQEAEFYNILKQAAGGSQ